VLAVLASAVFIVLGVIALVVAVRAPEEKQEIAATVMRGGFVSLGIGLTIAVLFWLYRRFTS